MIHLDVYLAYDINIYILYYSFNLSGLYTAQKMGRLKILIYQTIN